MSLVQIHPVSANPPLSLKIQFDTLLYLQFPPSKLFQNPIFSRNKQRNQQQHSNWVLYSVVQEEFDVIPVQSQDITDKQEGVVVGREDDGSDLTGQVTQVGGFSDGTLSFEGFSSATSSSSSIGDGGESEDTEKLIGRSINATIVSAAGTFAITKLLTIDQDYWQVSLHNILCFWMCILILMFYGEYLIICVSFA